jgi:(p)ppGpp synthase/HD superfamily hydrolase
MVKKALRFATIAHRGQKRKYIDMEYIKHPVETCNLLHEYTDGDIKDEILCAALLHDVVEDTDYGLDDIGSEFNPEVVSLVYELTTIKKDQKKVGKKKYLLDKMNNMSEDALTIKLADRLSNIGDLVAEEVPAEFVKKYVEETKFLMTQLKRTLTPLQKRLRNRITRVLLFLTLNRKIGR